MRGGIPLAARILAIASLIGDSASKEVVAAAKNVSNYRSRFFYTGGTEQRKRRKNARRKHNNGRRG